MRKVDIATVLTLQCLISTPKDKVTFLWMGIGTRGATSLKQLRMMVTAGDFADDRAYYW